MIIFYIWTLHFLREMSQYLSLLPLEFFFSQTTSSIYFSGWNWDHTSTAFTNHPVIIQVLVDLREVWGRQFFFWRVEKKGARVRVVNTTVTLKREVPEVDFKEVPDEKSLNSVSEAPSPAKKSQHGWLKNFPRAPPLPVNPGVNAVQAECVLIHGLPCQEFTAFCPLRSKITLQTHFAWVIEQR